MTRQLDPVRVLEGGNWDDFFIVVILNFRVHSSILEAIKVKFKDFVPKRFFFFFWRVGWSGGLVSSLSTLGN